MIAYTNQDYVLDDQAVNDEFPEGAVFCKSTGLDDISFPNGLPNYPVKYLNNALTLAKNKNLRKVIVLDNVALAADAVGGIVFGRSWEYSPMASIDLSTFKAIGVRFKNLRFANIASVDNVGCEWEKCLFNGDSYNLGKSVTLRNCHFEYSSGATITIKDQSAGLVERCIFGNLGAPTILDCDGRGSGRLEIAKATGYLKIINLTATGGNYSIKISDFEGTIELDSSCTGSATYVEFNGGKGNLIDNSAGTNVTGKDTFLNVPDIVIPTAADIWTYATRELTAGTRDAEIDSIKATVEALPSADDNVTNLLESTVDVKFPNGATESLQVGQLLSMVASVSSPKAKIVGD